MFEFLRKRLDQVRDRQAGLAAATERREAMLAEIKRILPIMKELLRDQRYQDYTRLLIDTRASCLAEREGLLRGEEDHLESAERHQRIALLTGRILQLEWILDAPEQFLTLAASGQPATGNGRPTVPDIAARPPARESGLVAADRRVP